jgi:hypothetical protein
MRNREAKWTIRLLLKDLRPAGVPEMVTLQCFRFQLPDLLKVCTSLPAALRLLKEDRIRRMPVSLDTEVHHVAEMQRRLEHLSL